MRYLKYFKLAHTPKLLKCNKTVIYITGRCQLSIGTASQKTPSLFKANGWAIKGRADI